METPTPKCPVCGSENLTGMAAGKTEAQIAKGTLISEGEVFLYLAGNRRETWKDRVVAKSSIAARVCLDCGHVSFFAADLASLRDVAAKIGK